MRDIEADEIMVVRILGMDYTVEGSDDLPQIGLQGRVSFTDQRITINEDISFYMQRSAILHEIIEAIDTMLELKLKHKQVSQLEASLNQVLSDNPLLLKLWTFEGEDDEEDIEEIEFEN